jgi:hypothetical protein
LQHQTVPFSEAASMVGHEHCQPEAQLFLVDVGLDTRGPRDDAVGILKE